MSAYPARTEECVQSQCLSIPTKHQFTNNLKTAAKERASFYGTFSASVIDVQKAFTEQKKLGEGVPVGLTVKGMLTAETTERRQTVERMGDTTGYGYKHLRKVHPGSFTAMIHLSEMTAVSRTFERSEWYFQGEEVRDFAMRDDITVVVTLTEIIVLETLSGTVINRISDPRFHLLHSIAFHPEDPNHVLITSTTLDALFEVDIATREVSEVWSAIRAGFNQTEKGFWLFEKGMQVPQGITVLSRQSILALLTQESQGNHPVDWESIGFLIDADAISSPLGLELDFNTVHPNWAGYSRDGRTILMTSYLRGEAVAIDRETGESTVILEGLIKPHGIIEFRDGYVIADTGRGSVFYIEENTHGYAVKAIYDLSGFPFKGGIGYTKERVQFAAPIDDNLLAIVDSARSCVFVIDPVKQRYARYDCDNGMLIQSVLPITSKKLQQIMQGSEVTAAQQVHTVMTSTISAPISNNEFAIARIESSGVMLMANAKRRTITAVNPDGTPFAGKLYDVIDGPVRAVLQITEGCNMGCPHCSESFLSHRVKIDKEILFRIVDELVDMQVIEIAIRGGEATIHPDFLEIWEYVCAKKNVIPTLTTNGYDRVLFTPEIVARLMKNKKAKVVVSLDGFPDMNAKHRAPKQYDRVMAWLPDAIAQYPDQLCVLSVVYRDNYDTLVSFARYLAEKGLRSYHVAPLKRLGPLQDTNDDFVSLNELNALQADLDAITQAHPLFRAVVSCPILDKYNGDTITDMPITVLTEKHFAAGIKVYADGDVGIGRSIMFSPYFIKRHNLALRSNRLGNAYEETISTIYKNAHDAILEQRHLADQLYWDYIGQKSQVREGDMRAELDSVIIYPTESCSLRCRGCCFFPRHQSGNKRKVLPIEKVDEIAKFQPTSVKVVGGGDPTDYAYKHYRFGDLIGRIRSKVPRTAISVFTNGVHVPEGDWQKDVSLIAVSLYGTSRENFLTYTGVDKFAQVLDNTFNTYFTESTIPTVNINFFYSKNNIAELTSLITELWQRWKKAVEEKPSLLTEKDFLFIVQPYADDQQFQDSYALSNLSFDEKQQYYAQLKEIECNNPELWAFINKHAPSILIRPLEHHFSPPATQCSAVKKSLILNADALLYPCFLQANGFYEVNFGDIETHSKEEILAKRKAHCENPLESCKRSCHPQATFSGKALVRGVQTDKKNVAIIDGNEAIANGLTNYMLRHGCTLTRMHPSDVQKTNKTIIREHGDVTTFSGQLFLMESLDLLLGRKDVIYFIPKVYSDTVLSEENAIACFAFNSIAPALMAKRVNVVNDSAMIMFASSQKVYEIERNPAFIEWRDRVAKYYLQHQEALLTYEDGLLSEEIMALCEYMLKAFPIPAQVNMSYAFMSLGEMLIKNNPGVYVMRSSTLYGAEHDENDIIQQLVAHRFSSDAAVRDNEYRDLVYVEDWYALLYQVGVERILKYSDPCSVTFDIGSGNTHALSEIWKIIEELIPHGKGQMSIVSTHSEQRDAHIGSYLFGDVLTTIKQGIAKAIDTYIDHLGAQDEHEQVLAFEAAA